MSTALPRQSATGQEAERKVIVFLVRHFNDIDHIVPIVYRMLKDSAARVELFCMNPYLDIRDDVRTRFLRERFGFRSKHVYQAHIPSLSHRLFGFLVCQAPFWKWPWGLRWLSHITRRIARRTYQSGWTRRLYDQEWATGWLQNSKVECLVIDFVNKGRFIYEAVADASDELGIRRIGVPHGLDMTKDLEWTNSMVAKSNPNHVQENWGWLGEFVVYGDSVKDRYSQLGVPAERITVLGSARYCKEWVDVYHRMLGPGPLKPNREKLKLVYMDHSAEYRVDTDAVVSSLRAVSDLGFVDVVVKPSTRVSLSDERLADFCYVAWDVHSVHLIQWADVVMTFTSSIIIDALMLKKAFVYPTYFHKNRMLWEEFGACWPVSNQDELIDTLRALHQGYPLVQYSVNNVQAFFTAIVYGGDPSADVLGKYVDYVVARKAVQTPSSQSI